MASLPLRRLSYLVSSSSVCLVLGTPDGAAQGLRLNGPLARPVGGDIRSAELSRDGAHLVYVADEEEDERFDLYSVDVREVSPVPVRLNLPADFADVQARFVISPDGSRVVYRADQETNNLQELFVVPIDGSAAPRKLNGPLAGNGDVDERFQLSPNGKRAVYLANHEPDRLELFTVSLDGSTPAVKLNDPIPAGSAVRSFAITADSRRVVLLAPRLQDQRFVHDLYGAPIDGRGGPVLLIQNADDSYSLGADGKRVFAVGPSAIGLREIQLVSALGGAPQRLARVPGLDTVLELELAAKDTRVVFNCSGLYSVPSDGSGPRIQLGSNASILRMSPDGERALYVSYAGALFSVRVDGSEPPVPLSGPMVSGGHVAVGPPQRGIEIAPDASRVVYLADQDVNDRFELYSVPVAGGSPVRLNSPLPAGGDVVDFELTPDSSRVAYVADQDADELFEVFVAPLDGSSAPSRVSPPLGPEGDVALRSDQDWYELLDPLRITPDSAHVIYLADQETPDAIELFRAPLDGSQITARLNGTLAVGPVRGDVSHFEFAPDGRRVVYLADQDEDNVFELYSVRSDGRERPARLNGDMAKGGDVNFAYDFLSPDGRRVVYRADQDTNDVIELYSSPIDGGGPPAKLNGALMPGGNVIAVHVDPSGRLVTFLSDQAVDERFELFSAAIDGSAPPVRLSGTMVPGGAAHLHEISPDGSRVVYLADQETDGVAELYSVPIDGSAAAVKLNGPMPPGGGVSLYELDPDSRFVAYSAAQEAADRTDVYVAPIDGSSAPVRISAAAAGARVSQLVFTPDGARVVAVVDPGGTGARLLFVAPRDGSQPPLQLSDASERVLGTREIQFSSDGARVLYVALGRTTSALFSVRLDGSAPRVQLSASLHDLEYPESGMVSPLGRAVYAARIVTGGYGLFSVPIDGSAAPLRLVPGSVYEYSLLQDGKTVLIARGRALVRSPLDGSTPPEILYRDAARNVGDFELHPEGDRIAFLLGEAYSYGGNDEAVELFLRPLDPAPDDRAARPPR